MSTINTSVLLFGFLLSSIDNLDATQLKQSTPAFVTSLPSELYISLEAHKDYYYNGDEEDYFTATTSPFSFVPTSQSGQLTGRFHLIFSTYNLYTAYQYIDYDWLTLIGTLGNSTFQFIEFKLTQLSQLITNWRS